MTVSAVNMSFQCPAICRFFEREPCSHFYLLNIRFFLESLKKILSKETKCMQIAQFSDCQAEKCYTPLHTKFEPKLSASGLFSNTPLFQFSYCKRKRNLVASQQLPSSVVPQTACAHGWLVVVLSDSFSQTSGHSSLDSHVQTCLSLGRSGQSNSSWPSSSPCSQPIFYGAQFPESRVVLR